MCSAPYLPRTDWPAGGHSRIAGTPGAPKGRQQDRRAALGGKGDAETSVKNNRKKLCHILKMMANNTHTHKDWVKKPGRRGPAWGAWNLGGLGVWGQRCMWRVERLAEYGWKPHRASLALKGLSRASIYWYMREKQRRTVSSNSNCQTVLVQQYSANLSRDSVQCHKDERNNTNITTGCRYTQRVGMTGSSNTNSHRQRQSRQ